MKLSHRTEILSQVLKQRTFARLMAFALVVVVFLLALKILSLEEKWVLIPQFDITRHASLTHSTFSDAYLTEWADGVVRDILTVNPSSIDHKVKRILEISAASSGALKKELQKRAEKIKREGVSTVFYPKKFQIFPSRQEVMVEGLFASFFGKDKAPIQKEKKFLLRFTRGTHGVILIDHFEEMKDEK